MCRLFTFLLATCALLVPTSVVVAGQVLVADRLTNSVYRYSETGALLGTVLTDSVNLNQATGIAISPDRAKLYVSSFQGGKVIRYDYNFALGTASNPMVFATAGLASPNAIRFSQDGNTIYVSNLGGTGVAQFNTNGSSAGPSINGPVGDPVPMAPPGTTDIFQFSGLAFAPTGELLVGGFQNFPGGDKGAIAKSDSAITTISNFIGPSASLNGASGLLVHEDYLYVSSMFASNIQRFNVTTGAVDPSFTISGLTFPQDLVAAPDGTGFLAGILGFTDGTGNIARYGFDGTLLGTFAQSGQGGFSEATAITVISPLLPGDFDNDGAVDAADLAVWQNNYGETGNAAYLLGDGDGDGDTDGRDFLVWQRQYGTTAELSALQSSLVPEPSAAIILFTAIASLGVRIRA